MGWKVFIFAFLGVWELGDRGRDFREMIFVGEIFGDWWVFIYLMYLLEVFVLTLLKLN
jgi:hypothetical protein